MLRLIVRVLLALAFLFAGCFHVLNPKFFLPIMPPWIPNPETGILVSGIALILAGVGFLVPVTELQRAAGWGMLLLLVAVFPANIYMATEHVQIHGFPSKDWMSWARLPLQPVLMLLVSWTSGIWPKSPRAGDANAEPEPEPLES